MSRTAHHRGGKTRLEGMHRVSFRADLAKAGMKYWVAKIGEYRIIRDVGMVRGPDGELLAVQYFLHNSIFPTNLPPDRWAIFELAAEYITVGMAIVSDEDQNAFREITQINEHPDESEENFAKIKSAVETLTMSYPGIPIQLAGDDVRCHCTLYTRQPLTYVRFRNQTEVDVFHKGAMLGSYVVSDLKPGQELPSGRIVDDVWTSF